MSAPRLRPRFQTIVPCHPQRAFDKFRLRLQQPDCLFEGTVLDTFISLSFKPEARHYWSPVLTVQSSAVEGSTHLRGHYTPDPHVWTLLWAIMAAICFGGIFITTYGCAQLLLGQTPWALLAIPIAVLGMAAVYGIALLGQWRAHDQMLQLKSFFDVSVCAQELAALAKANQATTPVKVTLNDGCAQCRQLCER